MLPLAWVDGRIVDSNIADPPAGDVSSRAVFTTTRVTGSFPWNWPAHLDRLIRSIHELAIDVQSSDLPSAEQVAAFVAAISSEDVAIRLSVAESASGGPARISLVARPLPEPLRSWSLVTFDVSASPLARHKLANRKMLATALLFAESKGRDDALLVNERGELLETTRANLFVRLDNQWLTPPLNDRILPGVARQWLIDHWPPPGVRQEAVPLARLSEIEEAFLSNSVRGVCPIGSIDGVNLSLGESTRQLQSLLAASMANR